jgi:short-subunit dehydrogenase
MTRKSIFITGAASGIGKETALLFARRGWFVGLFDLNTTALKTLEQEIGAGQCCWRRLDVTNVKEYKDALALFSSKTGGRMDALFNCAGVMTMGRFADIPLEDHLRTIEVNFKGVVAGTWLSLPLLRKSERAHVVSMCSASAMYGVPDLAVYSATKFGVKGFTEALNLELEAMGITVTDLMPLYVDTPMIRTQATSAGSLSFIGADTTPDIIADTVWKAVHGDKVHWIPTLRNKVLYGLTKVVPFLQRPVMAWISRRPG